MRSKNIIRCILGKGAVTGCLVLAVLSARPSALSVYAGPASDPSPKAQDMGPAGYSSPEDSGGGAGLPQAVGDSYTLPIANPVVKAVDHYSYDQMVQDLFALQERYPGKLTLRTIGQSLDGREIYDAIVGNPNADKKILIQGAIHGREYIVTPLLMQQLEAMLAEYDTGELRGQPLSLYLNMTAVHFVPMVNPDGVTISQQGEAGIRSNELRQTIQTAYMLDLAEGRTSLGYPDYLRRWKSNGRGVDPNYNYDADWETLRPELQHASWYTYRGPSPLSEPESRALYDLAVQNPFAATVSYHARGSILYWNTEGNQKAAESLELAAAASAVTGYSVKNDLGVGGFKDWHQRSEYAAPGITVEVGWSECPVNFSEYPDIRERNKQIPTVVLDYVWTH